MQKFSFAEFTSIILKQENLIVAVNCPHLIEPSIVVSPLSLSCHHFGVLRNQARYLHIIMMICIQIDAYKIVSLYKVVKEMFRILCLAKAIKFDSQMCNKSTFF